MRKIIHIDMDAFFASVEQRDNPELRGKPVIVGGLPNSRGVVAACSYEARKFGVHSAMASSRATKLCPKAIFIKPRFEAYRQALQEIHKVFSEYTKLIEPLSLDEAYLDVSDSLKGTSSKISATDVAKDIKAKIKKTTGLTASAGVSYNKFLAKIASDMDKPDGLYVIKPAAAQSFIEQLPIRQFYGVGKATEKKMHNLGVYNGQDLKRLSREQLQANFGRVANYYYQIARGIDERPVRAHRTRKSIGKEATFATNLLNKRDIWQSLQGIAERLQGSLEKKELCAKTLTLKVKYADFEQITRSQTVDYTLHSAEQILVILPSLLKKTEAGHRPIRLLGLSLSGLQSHQHKSQTIGYDVEQLALFEQN